jgi:putative ABC transport system permease protein
MLLSRLHQFLSRFVGAILGRSSVLSDFDQEHSSHVEMLAEEYERRGMSAAEAQRAARMRVGSNTSLRERHYNQAGLPFLDDLIQDLRYATRIIRRDRAFTAAFVLTVAVGVGINTSVFTLVEALLLRALPYRDPGQLIVLNRLPSAEFVQSRPKFLDWKQRSTLLQNAGLCTETQANITGGIEPVHIQWAQVSASFPELLGAEPLTGRAFFLEEDMPDGPPVAMISSRLWKQQFNSDAGVLTHLLAINGSKYTIVGVMPPRFDYPSGADVWTPTIHSALAHLPTGAISFLLIARMKSGVTLAQVIAQQKGLFGKQYGIEKEEGSAMNGIPIKYPPIAQSLHGELSAQQNRPILLLTGAATLVLLIACANIANLALARVVTRNPEFAIRRALGVASGRLFRQVLTEQALLGLLGGAAGLLMAYESVSWLRALLPSDWPSYAAVSINPSVVAFAVALSFAVGLLTSAAPSLRLLRGKSNASDFLTGGDRLSESAGQRRWRFTLVSAETSLAMLLLAMTGLLVQGFINLAGVDPGFRPNNLLTVSVTRSDSHDEKRLAAQSFYREVADRLRTLPGIRAVSAVDFLPARHEGVMMLIEAKAEHMQHGQTASPRMVMPDYFTTMGVPFLSGRDFSQRDTATAQRVAIVTDMLAKELWPGRDAVGQHLYAWGDKPLTVVGVVGSVRFFGPAYNPLPEVYLPYTQATPGFITFVVRGVSRPESYATAVRKAIHEVSPLQPIDDIRMMNDYWAQSMSGPRSLTAMASVFTGIGILLAVIGCYAVISYSVASRRKEFGIRLALGAQPNELLAACVMQTINWVLPGILVGAILAFTARRLLQAEVYGIHGLQVGLISALAFTLLAVSATAGLLAARRAAVLDPTIALRYEG